MNSRFREERGAFNRERGSVSSRFVSPEPRHGNLNASRSRPRDHHYGHDGRYGGPQYRYEGSRYRQNGHFEEDIAKLLKKTPENKRLESDIGQEKYYEKSEKAVRWPQQESQSRHHHTTDRERGASKHFKTSLLPSPKQEHQQVQKYSMSSPGDQQIKKFGDESSQARTPTAGGARLNNPYRLDSSSANTNTCNQDMDSNAKNCWPDAVQPVIQKSRSEISIRLECDKKSDEDKQKERKQEDNIVPNKGILKVKTRNFCEQCNIFFINSEALLKHESGLLHKDKLEKLKQQKVDEISANKKAEKKDTKKVSADIERKKRDEEEDEEEEEETSYCRYCDQSFTNPSSFYTHTRGMLHTQRLMAAETDKSKKLSEDQGPFTTVMTKSAEEETRGIKVVQPIPIAAVDEDNWMDLDQSTKEEVPLEKRDLAPEDILAKNNTRWLHCEVCNVTCSGEEPMQQHLDGAKHRNKAAKVDAGHLPVVSKVVTSPTDNKLCEVDTEALITKALAKSTVPLIGLQYVTEFQPEEGLPRYVCNLCENKCDGNTLIPHLAGGKHRLNYFKAHHPDIHSHLTTYNSRQKKSALNTNCTMFAADVAKKDGPQKVKVKLQISKRSAIAAESLLKRSGIKIPSSSITDFIKEKQALKRRQEGDDDEHLIPKKLSSRQEKVGDETDDHKKDYDHRTKGFRGSNYLDRHPYHFEERDRYRHPEDDPNFEARTRHGRDRYTDFHDDGNNGARGQVYDYNHDLSKSRDRLNLDYSDTSSRPGDKLVFDYSHSSSRISDTLAEKKEKLIFDYSDMSSRQNVKQVFDHSSASLEKRKKLVLDNDHDSSQGDKSILDCDYRRKSAMTDEKHVQGDESGEMLDEDLRNKSLRPGQNKQMSDLQQSNQGQGHKESPASEQTADDDEKESERLFKEFMKWKRMSATASSSGTDPSVGNIASSSELQAVIPPVTVMSHSTIPPAPHQLAQALPYQGVPPAPQQLVPGASFPVPAPQQLVPARPPTQQPVPSLKKPEEPRQKSIPDQSIPDGKVHEMLGALSQTLIKSEDEAAMALQVSNALTQALLKFRLQNVPEQMAKSTSNDPQSQAIQEQNFMVTQLTQHLKQSMAKDLQATVKSTVKQTESSILPLNTAGGPTQTPQVQIPKTVPLGAQQFNAYSIRGDRGEIRKEEMKAWKESLKKKAQASSSHPFIPMPPPLSNVPPPRLLNMPPPRLLNMPPPRLPMEPPPPLPDELPPPPPPPPKEPAPLLRSESLPSHLRSQSSHQHKGPLHQFPRGREPPHNQRGSKMSRF